MRTLALVLIGLALAAAATTSALILTLPAAPAYPSADASSEEIDEFNVALAEWEQWYPADRFEYALAGGILTAALLGAALVAAVAHGRPRQPR